MGRLRILECWLARHKWLLQRELPVGYDRLFIYEYQCQRCGKWLRQKVQNLDLPTNSKEGGEDGRNKIKTQ